MRLDEETRARRTATLGVDHPDTLTSLWSMAQDLIKLDRGALAVPLLDECLQRAAGKRVHRNFPEVANLRLRHFEKAKNAQECRTTAELWAKQKRTDVASLYQAAVCRAVTAAVPNAKNAEGADSVRLANVEADQAMAWLKNAVAAGFDDLSAVRTHKDLDALRDHAEFKTPLAELEKKQELKMK